MHKIWSACAWAANHTVTIVRQTVSRKIFKNFFSGNSVVIEVYFFYICFMDEKTFAEEFYELAVLLEPYIKKRQYFFISDNDLKIAESTEPIQVTITLTPECYKK